MSRRVQGWGNREIRHQKSCLCAGGEIRADENLIQGKLGLEVKGSEEANSLPVGLRRHLNKLFHYEFQTWSSTRDCNGSKSIRTGPHDSEQQFVVQKNRLRSRNEAKE